MKKMIFTMAVTAAMILTQVLSAQANTKWALDTIYCVNTDGIIASRNLYSYNSSGVLVETLSQNRENNVYVNSSKVTNTLDGKNNVLVNLSENWVNNAWINVNHNYKLTYTYDGNNNALTCLREIWQNNTWVNNYNYTYDGNGNQLTQLVEIWRNNTWENNNINTITYDGNNNRLTFLMESWENNTWENYIKYTYTYDNNNMSSYLREMWRNNTWENWYIDTYTYDGNNNRLTELSEYWQSSTNTWINSTRTYYTYDVNNNCNSAEYWTWNVSGSNWIAGSTFITAHYNNMQNSDMITSLAHKLIIVYKQVNTPNSIENVTSNSISIYPNPTTGILQISGNAGDIQQVSIFDLSGAQLLGTKNNAIDISHFPAGIYVVRVVTGEGVVMEKVLKY